MGAGFELVGGAGGGHADVEGEVVSGGVEVGDEGGDGGVGDLDRSGVGVDADSGVGVGGEGGGGG